MILERHPFGLRPKHLKTLDWQTLKTTHTQHPTKGTRTPVGLVLLPRPTKTDLRYLFLPNLPCFGGWFVETKTCFPWGKDILFDGKWLICHT